MNGGGTTPPNSDPVRVYRPGGGGGGLSVGGSTFSDGSAGGGSSFTQRMMDLLTGEDEPNTNNDPDIVVTANPLQSDVSGNFLFRYDGNSDTWLIFRDGFFSDTFLGHFRLGTPDEPGALTITAELGLPDLGVTVEVKGVPITVDVTNNNITTSTRSFVPVPPPN